MTAKKCIQRNLLSGDCICNVSIFLLFLAVYVLLHMFTSIKPQNVLPLFFFPFIHFMLLGGLLYFLMGKRCTRRQILIILVIFVFYISTAIWGFKSSGMRSTKTVKTNFKEANQLENIIWNRNDTDTLETK